MQRSTSVGDNNATSLLSEGAIMPYPNYNSSRDAEQLAIEIGKGIDDAAAALRWCKQHVQERRAAETLRLTQLNIGYIAMALDWQMEGELEKAFTAIDRIWWQPHREEEVADTSPQA
jgi:hypothetical protein